MPDVDFAVVGAGLAGACAALSLSAHGSVVVVEREAPASGGSGVAAGLINPILGVRARPVWRMAESLDALDKLVEGAGAEDLYRRGPTLRPAYGAEQIDRFRQSAADYPDHAAWLPADECANRFPDVEAVEGALLITTGGAIDLPAFIHRILTAASERGAMLKIGRAVSGWDDGAVALEDGTRIGARAVVLALGRGYARFPELRRLRLHQVKGQTIRLTRPDGLPGSLPHLAGKGYVTHDADGTLIAGSTYEHAFDHVEPTERHTAAILRKATQLLPRLAESEVVQARAGVRVTVPGIRLPMIGPLPGRRNVWIFTGFGAKGLLTAPLAARELPSYLGDPESITANTRVRLAR